MQCSGLVLVALLTLVCLAALAAAGGILFVLFGPVPVHRTGAPVGVTPLPVAAGPVAVGAVPVFDPAQAAFEESARTTRAASPMHVTRSATPPMAPVSAPVVVAPMVLPRVTAMPPPMPLSRSRAARGTGLRARSAFEEASTIRSPNRRAPSPDRSALGLEDTDPGPRLSS